MNRPAQSQPVDFSTVTEIGGAEAPWEQVSRTAQRYYWAGEYCRDRDVLEVACGVGQGLGYLATLARSVRAGDITPSLVVRGRAHYGDRVPIDEMDAQALPFPAASLDVVILFEALYYLPSAEQFVRECRRVLRPSGTVLIASANKDLYDFNPSPFSTTYYGVAELERLFEAHGFSCRFFGDTPLQAVSLRQRVLRPVKKLAVQFGLVPKTMDGKKLFKRLVFGKMHPLPAEITSATAPRVEPAPIPGGAANRDFKVIYLAATLPSP